MNTFTKSAQAKLLLVDDHQLILDGICHLLADVPNVTVVDAVTSGVEASRLIATKRYDAYILDVSLPDYSGFELIKQIREHDEQARIIVNTMHEEIWIVNRLGQCGVSGIVLKSSNTTELINAILNVLEGDYYACERFAAIWEKLHENAPQFDLKEGLTRREKDVLQAVALGKNTHEIADELKISENTVETFRRKLIQKLGAKNGVDMVVKAIRQGWVELDK